MIRVTEKVRGVKMSWGERGWARIAGTPLYALMILKEHSSNETPSPFSIFPLLFFLGVRLSYSLFNLQADLLFIEFLSQDEVHKGENNFESQPKPKSLYWIVR